MSKNKTNTLLNERVIRRWGKLANMPALTENFLDTIEEEEEAAPEGMEMEMDAEEPDEAPAAGGSPEEAAVEKLVQVVVDALAEEVPEMDIELEKDGEGEMEMEMGEKKVVLPAKSTYLLPKTLTGLILESV